MAFFSRERFKLAGLHMIFSIILLCVALFLVFGVWYPSPLDIAVGVTLVYLILLGVDLVIGPLLTFIVYKLDKNKLKFDLAIIVILQLSAYTFGLYTLAQGRPVWQVFVVDDIELVSPIDVRETKYYEMKDQFSPSIFQGPQWVAAVFSDDEKIREEQRQDEMFDGISLATRPETYQKLNLKKSQILSKLKPMDKLYQFNVDKNNVKRIVEDYPKAVGWLPMKAPELDMVVFFDSSAQPIKIVNLRPWD